MECVWVCLGKWVMEDPVKVVVAKEGKCANSVAMVGHALHEPW